MNVIVQTIPELCGHEDQSKEVEGYTEEIKNTLLTKNFVNDIHETISKTCSCLWGYFYHYVLYMMNHYISK